MYQLTSAAVQKKFRPPQRPLDRAKYSSCCKSGFHWIWIVCEPQPHTQSLQQQKTEVFSTPHEQLQQQKTAEKKWAHTPQGFWQILKGCLIISGLNYVFNQIKTVKVRNTRPVKKIREHINPESCKKASTYSNMLPLCYICASTRVKHLTKIQDHSFADTYSYTGIKKLLDLQPIRM